jgi:hypothetical protein
MHTSRQNLFLPQYEGLVTECLGMVEGKELSILKHGCGESGNERACQLPMWSGPTEIRPHVHFR